MSWKSNSITEMVIGDISNIAIEYELEEDYEGVWLLGRICLWLKNKKIGNFEQITTLRDVLFLLTRIVKDRGNRQNIDFEGLSLEELFNKLETCLYGDASIEEERIGIDEQWARFDVWIAADVLDDIKMYLVENSQVARLLIGFSIENEEEYKITEYNLEPGEFDNVLFETFKSLDQLYEIELNNDSNLT